MKKVILREAAKISSNTIVNLGNNESMRMEALIKIAITLDCKVEDLFVTMKEEQ